MHTKNQAKKPLTGQPLRMIALGFVIVILCGTLLLLLPAAARSGESCGLWVALFTATSATCVTGLTLVDTAVYWSGFGQAVILLLVQIGGLGVMLTGGLILMLLDGRISVKERMLLGHSVSSDSLAGVVRMTKWLLIGTFAMEAVGALLLTLRFQQDFGWAQGIKYGIFHSVSAFCNAGFDLMGGGDSLAAYRNDPAVTLTICTLIVLGGLGFYVWNDLLHRTVRRRQLQMHTKTVLAVTAALLLLGAAGTLLLERNNPATLGGQGVGGMLMDALFHSVNCRNAGFSQIAQADFTPGGRLLTQILMFIGGSPGSTSGGIKTTTLAILLKAAIAAMQGREDTVLFRRTVPRKTVSAALCILVTGFAAVLAAAAALLILDPLTLEQAMFEAVATFGTAGISVYPTAALSCASQVVLMVLMFVGRVGIMTLGLGMLLHAPQQQDIRYADGKIMI